MRVNGNAMINAGIHSGDVVIVDRSIKATSGKVIIAVLNGEMLIRRYEEHQKRVRLVPATRKLATIDVDPAAEFSVWGVVTYVIHGL
ncbi:MAG TPA: S24 family peptidase, partial [Chitinophagaceae bacterium]|jgi:DNA polymerase V|nr:S24 family peptidase [Chitinophagaceae bacterium]